MSLQEQEIDAARGKLLSLCSLARGNFPRDCSIKIQTNGTDPSAAVTIQPWVLEKLLKRDNPNA